MRTHLSRKALLNVSLLFFIPHVAVAASFTGLGHLPGGRTDESRARGISADGSVVVGISQSVNEYGFNNEAFRWTEEGINGLGFLETGVTYSQAYGVSATGAIVVGESGVATGNEAFRWTESDGMVGISDLGGVNSNGRTGSSAFSVSADGSVVVGSSNSPYGQEAFRWTENEGMLGLGDLDGGPFYSQAVGVSDDGALIVGQSITDVGREAFVWTQGSSMQGIGTLAGDLESVARGITGDGTTIVGWSGVDDILRREACRWTQSGEIQGLGDLDGGGFWSEARDISADGSIIVGRGRTELGDFAVIWDEINGMRNLQELLANEYGLDIAGWHLQVATAVSADGLTITGYGFNPDGRTEAWMVRLDPEVVDVAIDIKPGSETNSINLSSAGVIPVAILGSDTFDVETVDPTTVSLAGASVKMVGKSGKHLCHKDDVNNDGVVDLVCQVYTTQFTVEVGVTNAILEAETFDGIKLRGEGIIRIVPDK